MHSSLHSVILLTQHRHTERPFCTRWCPRHWRNSRGQTDKILALTMLSILLVMTGVGLGTDNEQINQIHNKMATSDLDESKPGKGAGKTDGVESVCV